MKKLKKRIMIISVIIIVALGVTIYAVAPIATGYPAKYMCSSVFVSGMSHEEVWENYIRPENFLFKLVDYDIDEDSKSIEVSMFGLLLPTKAHYTEGCGCTLTNEKSSTKRPYESFVLKTELEEIEKEWPLGNRMVQLEGKQSTTKELLDERIAKEFEESPGKPRKNTWGIAVVYKDQLWNEKYAEGITNLTPLLSWSASKSLTGTLMGRWFTINGENWNQAVNFKENSKIKTTWKDLLQMQDGISFKEAYRPFSDATKMLYESPDMAKYVLSKDQKYQSGTHWNYSSGTTNIIASLLKEKTGGTKDSFEKFAREELLNKLGIREAIFEYDNSGTFVGSSYFFASPQSWLKIAMLYKNKGVWNGEQILSQNWVDFALSPASNSGGKYGAQIWLNRKHTDSKQLLPKLPEDTFMFQGYQGQYIVVIPSWDLMIARMGAMQDPDWKMEDLVLDIYKILKGQ